jgi:predicted dehydrogenase
MSAPKLVVAYVGAGIFAKMAHAPALKILSDRYEVRVVCNRTIERALELAADLGVARENVYSDYQKVDQLIQMIQFSFPFFFFFFFVSSI